MVEFQVVAIDDLGRVAVFPLDDLSVQAGDYMGKVYFFLFIISDTLSSVSGKSSISRFTVTFMRRSYQGADRTARSA